MGLRKGLPQGAQGREAEDDIPDAAGLDQEDAADIPEGMGASIGHNEISGSNTSMKMD
jgi:hypothetical protein